MIKATKPPGQKVSKLEKKEKNINNTLLINKKIKDD